MPENNFETKDAVFSVRIRIFDPALVDKLVNLHGAKKKWTRAEVKELAKGVIG